MCYYNYSDNEVASLILHEQFKFSPRSLGECRENVKLHVSYFSPVKTSILLVRKKHFIFSCFSLFLPKHEQVKQPSIAFHHVLPFKNNFHFKLYFIASIEHRNMTSVVIADKVDEYNTLQLGSSGSYNLKKMLKCVCLLLKTIMLIPQLCYILVVTGYKWQILFSFFACLCCVCVMFNVLTGENTVSLEHNKKWTSLGAIITHMQTLLT